MAERQALETGSIDTGPGGVWNILKRGDEVCIVDNEGRERHRSQGHLMTAVHLAMHMARWPLPLNEEADASLRQSAEDFAKE
jgi:hypothetical protein